MKINHWLTKMKTKLRQFDDRFIAALQSESINSFTQEAIFPDPQRSTAVNLPLVKALSPLPMGQQRATILLVDDDVAVRVITTELLQEMGYAVLPFDNGIEAVRYAKQHPEIFDLLITDMRMPLMNGVAVAEAFLLIRPDLPILLISGYLEDVPDNILSRSRLSCLLKPYSQRDLAIQIRLLLQ